MKATPLTVKPPFPLMKQGDIQNIYHLQMPRWLFDDPRYMGLALVEGTEARRSSIPFAGPEYKVVTSTLEVDTVESNRSAKSASLDEILCPVSSLEMPEQDCKKCENGISRSAGMELLEVPKWHPSYKEKNYTDLIHTESSPSVIRQTDAELLKSRDGQTEVVGPDSRKPQQYQSMYSEPFKLFRICKTVSTAINSLDIAVVSGVEPQLLPQGRNEVRHTCGCIPIILVPNAFVYLFFTEYDSWVVREKIKYIELFYCQRNRIAIYIYPPAQRVNG